MLLVHAINLEDTDFDLLRSKQPALVHCPKSNAKLAHGVARLPEIRDTGITIGLGTDSVASNNVVDMFEEMRAAIFQQRARTKQLDAINAESAFRTAGTVLNVREQVSQLGFLGFEILFCAVGWRDLNWNAFDNVDTGRFQCIEFLRIVRHQTDAGDSEMTENAGT